MIRRINLWPWVPVFVIGVAMAVNAVMFLVARSAAPRLVEPTPYLATRDEDARQAARHAFAAAGLSLAATAASGGIEVRITGGPVGAGVLRLVHPADPLRDRDLAWAAGATAALVPAAPGRWWIQWTSADGGMVGRIAGEAGR